MRNAGEIETKSATMNCFLISFTLVTEKFKCLCHKHSGKLLFLIGPFLSQNLNFPRSILTTESNKLT